jgi:hypothetical protein
MRPPLETTRGYDWPSGLDNLEMWTDVCGVGRQSTTRTASDSRTRGTRFSDYSTEFRVLDHRLE